VIKTRNAKNDAVIKSAGVIVSNQPRKIDNLQQSEVLTELVEETLDAKTVEWSKQKVSDVKVYGDGDAFQLLCEKSSTSQGFVKSTKVCNVTGGCLVQTETQQRNPDGSYVLSQALTYCPGVHIAIDQEPRELLRAIY
jgi:hypothetical protein